VSIESYIELCYVKVGGTALTPLQSGQLAWAEVDDSLYMPSMVTLCFMDVELELLDGAILDIGKEIEVAMGTSASNTVFKGEITSIEPEFTSDHFMTLVVRGYDKRHRLIRHTNTKTYVQMTDSDVISAVASAAGLSVEVTSTSVVVDHIIQDNQSDYDFIQERARRVGQVIRMQDGTLTSKPLADYANDAGPTLKYGEDLFEFRARLSAVSQPDSVEVRSWDIKTKKAIVGQASSGTPVNAVGQGTRGARLASGFGASGAYGVVDTPVATQDEAAKLAQAVLDEARNGDIQAEAVGAGNHLLRAGVKVAVQQVGTKFSGNYLVTRAVHRMTSEQGYRTSIESTNGTGETTAALVTAPGASAPRGGHDLVVGVVSNNEDPDKMGRVKVKFPWMIATDNNESDWARVAAPMAGNDRGFLFLPEVNDEVLVGFEHGETSSPYILGGLWNGKDNLPSSAPVASGAVVERIIKTKAGHIIRLTDKDGSEKIEIIDKATQSITIDSANKKITIKGTGDISIEAAQNVEIKGTTKVTVTGQEINVKADTNLKIEAGAQLELKASAGIKIDGGAMTEIKGGMVKIN
jgi:Rhs element Vgr protein